jgi:DNA-binding beta-propeller fold protein YncE
MLRAWATSLIALAAAFCAFAPATAVAATETPPDLLWQSPEDELTGDSAGRMFNPWGVAASPTTGDIYVADLENSRVAVFDVWGGFLRAWGYGVDPGDGSSSLQTCTSDCQEGIAGSGPGQLSQPTGVAVDAAEAVYVYDTDNKRVVKYDSQGNLLLTFGGAGSAPGEFENGALGDYIDVGPAGTIFVGDVGRIQEFEPDGSFKSQIPFTGDLAGLAGAAVRSLAIDPTNGDLLVVVTGDQSIYRLSSTGALKGEVDGSEVIGEETKSFPVNPRAVTVDSVGNVYAIDQPTGGGGPYEVLKFGPDGGCLICGQDFAQPDDREVFGIQLNGLAAGTACGIDGDDVYVTEFSGTGDRPLSYVRSYGPPPQDVVNCPPPQRPPAIEDQYARSVGAAEARLQARINPLFFADTTYYVQYGPDACLASDWQQGCSTFPVPPGSILTSKVQSRPVATAILTLSGLSADTTYHYRFVAQSSGGGPVFGVGGTESEDGDSSSFHTLALPFTLKSDCPNQTFRTGASAFLPDCRAFEMVSPVDKNGGDIDTQKSLRGYPAALDLTDLSGDEMTFSSSTAFAGALGAPFVSQYRAQRGATGWTTESISPPRNDPFNPVGTLLELDLQFKLFTPDLSEAWLMQEADPPLDACGIPGFVNIYRRDNLTGAYEAITTAAPEARDPDKYVAEVQGVSADGTTTIFRANDRLTADAAPGTEYQIYEHVREPGQCAQLRLVSLLPGEIPNPTASSVGTEGSATADYTFSEGRENLVDNAVSPDASRIYWTAAASKGGEGRIYLRLNGTETIPVSSSAARFWKAAEDGSAAYYIQNGNLFRYTLANKKSILLAKDVIGLLGANDGASRAFIVSKDDLDGAVGGQPNVFMLQGTTATYITTLSAADVSGNSSFTPADAVPTLHSSRVSDDGSHLIFTSDASLTGFDNADAESGIPDTEVYLYDAETETLRCVSCNATGARPTGRVVVGANNTRTGFASRIPPWKNQFHAARILSDDGSRLFFESFEVLSPRDHDEGLDVYQWSRADNAQQCEAMGAEAFNDEAGGCLSLLSSGTDPDDAELVDSTPDASSVFIKTNASLLPQDPGRIDIYVARVGGGFPPPFACGNPEGCPAPVPPNEPPTAPDPGSRSGDGNPTFGACKQLEHQAVRLRAKARRLGIKARKAAPAKARKLRKKAKQTIKKAKKLDSRARKCFTSAGGR